MNEKEIVDLVSEEDVVIGQVERDLLYERGSLNFRVVNGLIVKKTGHIWVPRRASSKKLFPRALDTSVGGHVKSGETYLEAFFREAREEVQLDLTKVPFKFLGKLTPKSHQVSAFMHVYEIPYEKDVLYNSSDFEGFDWLLPEEILEKLAQGEKAKSDLEKIIQFYMEM